MKTNHRVWPADSAACAGSGLTNLQHVTLQQWGLRRASWSTLPRRQTEQGEEEEKKEQSKLQLKAIEVVPLFQSHPVRVLHSLFIYFFGGGIWLSKTPSGHALGLWIALFRT